MSFNNPFKRSLAERKVNSVEEDSESSIEVGTGDVPKNIKQEFKRLRDSVEGEMTPKKCLLESLEEGVKRYRLFGELRDEDTRIEGGASPFGHLLNNHRKEVVMTVDERSGEIIHSEISDPKWDDTHTTHFS